MEVANKSRYSHFPLSREGEGVRTKQQSGGRGREREMRDRERNGKQNVGKKGIQEGKY